MIKPAGYALAFLSLGGCAFFGGKRANPNREAFDQFLYPRQRIELPHMKTAKDYLMEILQYMKAHVKPEADGENMVYKARFGNVTIEHCEGPNAYTQLLCEHFQSLGKGIRERSVLRVWDRDNDGNPDRTPPGTPPEQRNMFHSHIRGEKRGVFSPAKKEELKRYHFRSTDYVLFNLGAIYREILEIVSEDLSRSFPFQKEKDKRGRNIDIRSSGFLLRLFSDDLFGNSTLEGWK